MIMLEFGRPFQWRPSYTKFGLFKRFMWGLFAITFSPYDINELTIGIGKAGVAVYNEDRMAEEHDRWSRAATWASFERQPPTYPTHRLTRLNFSTDAEWEEYDRKHDRYGDHWDKDRAKAWFVDKMTGWCGSSSMTNCKSVSNGLPACHEHLRLWRDGHRAIRSTAGRIVNVTTVRDVEQPEPILICPTCGRFYSHDGKGPGCERDECHFSCRPSIMMHWGPHD